MSADDRRRFVVVGEALVDIVVRPDGGTVEHPGGSPLNVAVGLARLAVPTLLLTDLGDDARGRAVAGHARSSGAELPESTLRPNARTSTATARVGPDGAAEYDFDLTWNLPPQELVPDAAGLHVGSLGTVLTPGRDVVADLVRQARARRLFVSYDPNVRPAFLEDPEKAWRDLVDLAGRCTLVKMSDEDLRALRPGMGEEEAVAELLEAEATELVIVTHGGAGAAAHRHDGVVRRAAPPVDVVDTVGAGDTFTAATLAVLEEWDLTTAGAGALRGLDDARVGVLLDAAMAAAAVTCSRPGADPPTRRELPPRWPLQP